MISAAVVGGSEPDRVNELLLLDIIGSLEAEEEGVFKDDAERFGVGALFAYGLGVVRVRGLKL